MHTKDDNILKNIPDHNHFGDCASAIARKKVQQMKKNALDSTSSSHWIISKAAMNISPAVATKLPAMRSLKRTIRRYRQKHSESGFLRIPLSLMDITIPFKYQKYNNGENFLLFDSGPIANRMLIFGSNLGISILKKSKKWFADGTFKNSCKLFAQIYTIHGLVGEKSYSAVFALLPNKMESTYVEVCFKIKNNKNVILNVCLNFR